MLKDLGEAGKARELIERAAAIFAGKLPADHPHCRETQRRLAAIKRMGSAGKAG